MKHITSIRKAVCTMANELRKTGYSLSQAFRKAWKRIRLYCLFLQRDIWHELLENTKKNNIGATPAAHEAYMRNNSLTR